jgi:hypothetical protein
MLTLTSTQQASLSRTDLEDFIVAITVDVLAHDETSSGPYVVGRIAMDRILWRQACARGESLFDVCDCDSQGMHEMHMILTDGTNDIREDFNLDEPIDDVLFIHQMLVHPDLKQHRQAILDGVVNLHMAMSLAAIWQQTCDFTDPELNELGFRKIAGEPLFVRSWSFPSRFEEEHPDGLDIDFDGTPAHEEWVESEWKKTE